MLMRNELSPTKRQLINLHSLINEENFVQPCCIIICSKARINVTLTFHVS